MAHDRKACDVFISHAAGDAALAREVAAACRADGLMAVTPAELPADVKRQGDAIWEALAESRAVIFLVSPVGLTPNMTVEMGAAWAWNKPIYGVVIDPTAPHVPLPFGEIKLYPVGRIEDVLDAVRLSARQFSDDDRETLNQLYSAIGVPVDQYALEPLHLQELVKRFRTDTGKSVSGERLLSELLRMRKQGKLTKNRVSGRSKPRSDSA
jgi:hypothetical protein